MTSKFEIKLTLNVFIHEKVLKAYVSLSSGNASILMKE